MSQERFAFSEAPALEMGCLPRTIEPMLPAPGREPFDSPSHIFEVLWDGLRALLFIEAGAVRVQDRYLRDVTAHYPELADAPRRVRSKGVVLDGVLVALDEEGHPDFRRLSPPLAAGAPRQRPAGEERLTYQAFDILYYDGRSVMALPFWRRRGLLQQVVRPRGCITTFDSVEGEGVAFFEAARDHGLEGIVAKKKDGLYRPGERSDAWLRLSVYQQGEFVIGGYTYGGGKKRHPFGSLLLGLYDSEGRLVPVGEVAGGFDEASAKAVLALLDPLQTGQSPFAVPPPLPRLIFWCRPQAVCRVRFGGWTPGGKLRFTIFVALRPDVPPSECCLERLRSARPDGAT
ncbi:MAG: non-homologous end-joining DNA ligase [Dehalococcoidia bacterium]